MLAKRDRYAVWWIMGWLIMSVLACSVDLGVSPTATPTETPQPTKSESSSGSEEVVTRVPSDSQRAGLTVINNTGVTMCYVYISLSTEEYWGIDRLGDDEKIPVGGKRTFSLGTGTWDIRIEDCSENVLLEQSEMVITGSHTLTVSDSSSSSGGTCGDGVCTTFENAGSCPQDCSTARCGNGVCESSEDVYSCAEDCGVCGDGVCTTFENPGNCPEDCGGGSSTCGNGVCENGEDVYNCDVDCGFCGDGLCTTFENGGNCPEDCG